jgi:phosphatidylglycerophosphate synthase
VHRVQARPLIGPPTGFVGVLVLLGALGATVGLGGLGWTAGLACGAGATLLLARSLTRRPAYVLGPADWVTLGRAVLVCGVAALTADSFNRPAAVPTLVTLAAIALVLDGVDGWLARRTGTASAFGARFDMEVDAFLILVLSGYAARPIGWWVLLIGVARYLFVAAGSVLPWLRGSVPPRAWCKVVAVIQGVVLTVAAADVLPLLVSRLAVGIALVLLAESFGRETWELWHARVHAGHTEGRVSLGRLVEHG